MIEIEEKQVLVKINMDGKHGWIYSYICPVIPSHSNIKQQYLSHTLFHSVVLNGIKKRGRFE